MKITRDEFDQFFRALNEAQYEEIRKYKWIESEKAGHDLGNDCCLKWIALFAAKFRHDFIREFFHADNIEVEN